MNVYSHTIHYCVHATDDAIDVQIRTPDGLIPSRLLQIHWRKISETPALPG